jgi:outer membrane protein assembly factor BamA
MGKGYLSASIDSIVSHRDTVAAYIYVGTLLDAVHIYTGNVPESYLGELGMRKYKDGRPIPPDRAGELLTKTVQLCENTGYPFAEARYDSFGTVDGHLTGQLVLDRHELIVYDSLQLQGKTRVKRVFLKNYLGIRVGRVYNESVIARITQRISDLTFAESIQPHTVTFSQGRARVNLFLRDKRASQFDILIGVLPGGAGQGVLITGDVKLHLVSPFGVGEDFYIQWQKLQPQTQTLNVRFSYPYLLGLPLGVSVVFDLYKKDSTYIDLHGDYGVQYQISGADYVKASLRQKNTILLYPDTNYVKSNRSLPPNVDLSVSEFSVEYFTQRLNYRFNPVSGFMMQTSAAAGARTIYRNAVITQIHDDQLGRNFGYLYDSTRLLTFQLHLALLIDKYWRLAKRQTIRTMLDARYLYAPVVYENEKYRLGGINSLRGFDDRSIFTPYYSLLDVEYRFLLSKNSYFYAFFNTALVQDARHITSHPIDFPFGFGIGSTFETKIGLFGISYAMGRQFDNPISFKSGKIHFGYINYF